MKTLTLILSLLLVTNTLSQNTINIGSTKEQVKNILGHPNSIRNFDGINQETWSYGKNNLATLSFKKDTVFEYTNYKNILKIGNKNSDSLKSNPLDLIDNEVLENLKRSSKNNNGLSYPNETKTVTNEIDDSNSDMNTIFISITIVLLVIALVFFGFKRYKK